MVENQNKGTSGDRSADPDLRFKYLGFEVKPGKIGNLFRSEDEKQSWIKRILEKRKSGVKLREECSLTEPRVAPYERIVLTITSLLLIFSLFLPWFSGYKESEVATIARETMFSRKLRYRAQLPAPELRPVRRTNRASHL